MDCDDVMLALAAREDRTLTELEEVELHAHLDGCEACRGVASRPPPSRDPATDATIDAASDPSAPRADLSTLAERQPRRGDAIGRFVVLDLLGAGGMGVVFSAYDPYLDRKVAIKLLHRTKASSADGHPRLLREAQAMARIKHPNVIKVHEVGTHDTQVYVAMEFADAGTLRAWFEGAARTPREILAVFVEAGRGLAAAHDAGLVHRDFKPDNVLMAKDGSVLVTDFGLVSAVDEPPELDPLITPTHSPAQHLTHTGTIMGTPAYMAPEQFDGKPTAKSDQFAFCVALYEALYGERPFGGETYLALQASVRSGEIAPPAKSATVPSWLRHVLLRGMAREQDARFPSMTALLAALTRAPLRRRRVVAAAAAIAMAGVATTALAMHASPDDPCTGGDARVASVWNPARRAAMQAAFEASRRPQAARSFATASVLVDDWMRGWESGFVEACRATHVRAEQSPALLDRRMLCLTRRLDESRATIDALIAGGDDAVNRAVDATRALPELAPCADPANLLADVPPPETPTAAAEVAGLRAQLDDARGAFRLGRYAPALAIARRALARARAAGYLPATAEALTLVGTIEHSLGDRNGAATLDEAVRVAAEAGDEPRVVDAAAWLVLALAVDTSQLDAAEKVASFANGVVRHAHAPAEPRARLETSTGVMLERRGRPDDARKHLERALELATKELGDDHPVTLTTLGELGELAHQQGRAADARGLLERVAKTRERTVGVNHPSYAHALAVLGDEYRREAKLDDAQRDYDRALTIRIATLGPDNPEVAASYNSLGLLHAARGDHVTARRYYERALAIWEKAYGPDNVEVAAAVINLGVSYVDRGDTKAARPYYERGLALYERAHGPDHPSLVGPLENLGVIADTEGRRDEALALFQRALRITERVYGPDHPDAADNLMNIASVYIHRQQLDAAEETTARALHIAEKVYGADHPRVAMALANLAHIQGRRNHVDDALASFHKSLAIFEAKLGASHPHVSQLLGLEGQLLVEHGRGREAIPLFERALAIRIAAKLPSDQVATAQFGLAKALAADPRQRARSRQVAATAIEEFAQAKDTEDVATVQAWLRTH